MCQSVGFGWGARRGPVSPLPLPPLAPQRAPPSSAPLPTPTYAKTAPPAAACTYLPPLGQRGKVCPWVYPWKRNAAQSLAAFTATRTYLAGYGRPRGDIPAEGRGPVAHSLLSPKEKLHLSVAVAEQSGVSLGG